MNNISDLYKPEWPMSLHVLHRNDPGNMGGGINDYVSGDAHHTRIVALLTPGESKPRLEKSGSIFAPKIL